MSLTSASRVAVTGSTGALGGLVARDLAATGVPQRLLVRDTGAAPELPDTVVSRFSYSDARASAAALEGAETLFMVSASESADRLDQHRTFVDAAASAGVRHVVYTSFVGAAPDAVFTLGRDHYWTEQHIKEAGLSYTFLRNSFYIDFMDTLVGEDLTIRGPAGDGKVSVVAREDIARVAAAVLRDPGAHRDATYYMTGPEALSMTEVARALTLARGQTVTFHDETIPEAYESRRRWGAPDWQNDAWVSTYTAIASGDLAAVSDDVETITGRRPLTLAEFLLARPHA